MAKVFEFEETEILGRVVSVDTMTAIVEIDNIEKLRKMQVNRLVALESDAGQHLIGLIQKITRKSIETVKIELNDENASPSEQNLVRIGLIGTLFDKKGTYDNVFTRTVESVPRINAACYAIEDQSLTKFMQVIAQVAKEDLNKSLLIGTYTLDENADAYLQGDKFFQRHAVVVGSTGSGKSWTTARLLEQISALPNGNAIVFDIHGEYKTLTGDGFKHLRVAGSADLDKKSGLADGVLYLPYWLLSYEALVSMLVDRSDQNAPNQAMIISRAIINAKEENLQAAGHKDVLDNFTIDSPVPFDVAKVVEQLIYLNEERVPGAKTDKAGDFNGKLSRLIARLEAKISDRRLGFLFRPPAETIDFKWLDQLVTLLMSGRSEQLDKKGGVKIIDFSEVPSDILPLMVSLLAKLAFSVHQWQPSELRHPISLFCDEAHLYIPDKSNTDAAGEVSVNIFERIAKEGRKYGIGLVVISQRPSEVNKTVISQCNNLLAMRLTNGEDQAVIKKLLPDSLGGFGEILPVLDIGEALIVGDASLLPSRIRVKQPSFEPSSATVPFWKRWSADTELGGLEQAVNNWRKQSISK